MKRKLRVKVVEITRQTAIMPRSVFVYCSQCEANAEVLTREEASALLRASDLDLEGLILKGIVHSLKAVNGTVWICKNSLFQEREVES